MKNAIKTALIILVITCFPIAISLLLIYDKASDSDFRQLQEYGTWTFHTYVGLLLFILYVLVIIIWQFNRRLPAVRQAYSKFKTWFGLPHATRIKGVSMIVLGLTAIWVYVYCHQLCEKGGSPIFEPGIHFFHMLFRLTLSFFPYFILGCILGGFINKYFASGRWKFPNSMVGAGILGAVIPECSCGVIPLVRGMLDTGQVRVRTVIAFLMISPVLSPFVLALSFELGLSYVVARIAAIFILGISGAVLVERFAGVREEGGNACYRCAGCARSTQHVVDRSNGLLASWNILLSLIPYIIIGVLISALLAKFVPASIVGEYLSGNFTGLLIASTIGIPIYLCSGQEVLILAPLMNQALMGANALPLGHAIAFTISGTGICLSSIPALLPTIGRRATIMVIVVFWVGSVLLGLLINFFISLPFLQL